MELFALALATVVFIFTYVYLKDEYEREPLQHLVLSFVLGILCAFPVVFIGGRLRILLDVSGNSSPLELIVYAFVVVALVEEGMKYLVLRWYCYRHEEFDEPYDGIMYGVAISMGFAAIENVLYVFGEGGGWETGVARMLTAVPAHGIFGVFMGYYVGKAKFMSEGNAYLERMKGLGAAVLWHGGYDYFLFLGWEELVFLSLAMVFLGVRLSRKAIKLHQSISPHKAQIPLDSQDSFPGMSEEEIEQ